MAGIKQPKVALVGRPNVGKSTFFNRLVGRKVAIVHDQPGVTRDRREAPAHLYGLDFIVIDTAGLADPTESQLTERMMIQTRLAIQDADVVIFMLDGRDGMTPMDEDLVQEMRRAHKPIIVAVNKCEGKGPHAGLLEAYTLGIDPVIPISAEHGEGLVDLHEALLPYVPEIDEPEEETNTDESSPKPLQLAIIGRPNVGKSTLINYLIGQERLLTADMPGVTRDAIELDWTYEGRPIHIVDTAGLRRRSKVDEAVESLAARETRRIIQYAEVVVLLLDANAALEKQDLAIAHEVVKEGRALVVAVNKIDLVGDVNLYLKKVREMLEYTLSQVQDIPCIGLSAKKGRGCDNLMNAVLKIENLWNTRLPTAALNRWLDQVTQMHPPPMVSGRRIRLKYMTQVKSRPPTFCVFASQAQELPDSYQRYLVNRLRQDFDMPGVPIRLQMRRIKNPYADA